MVAAAAPRRLGQGAWISLDGSQRQETATFFDMPALKVYLKGIRREYHPEHCLCCVSLPPGRTVKPLQGRWIHTKKSGRLFKSSSAPQWTLRHCSGPVDLDADADESMDAAEAASPTTTTELSPGDAELAPGDAELASGDAELALGDAEQAPGDAELAPGDAELAPGDAVQASGDAELALGDAEQAPGDAELAPGDAELAPGDAAAAVPEPEEELSFEDISAMARAAVEDLAEPEDSWTALLEAELAPGDAEQAPLPVDLYPRVTSRVFYLPELAPGAPEQAPSYNFQAALSRRIPPPREEDLPSWLNRVEGESLAAESLPAAAESLATFSDFPDF